MNKEITEILYAFADSSEDEQVKLKKLIKDLQPHLTVLEEIRAVLQENEQDFRNGFETYKYESVSNICADLEYISDRWTSAFRVNWLIGLINPQDIFHVENYKQQGDILKDLRN